MKPTDVIVQVRDKGLNVVGTVDWSDEDETARFQLHKMHANVGTWDLTLPVEHPLADPLDTPGAGVVIKLNGSVIASGPITTPALTQNYQDPKGTIRFEGVTDTIVIADSLAWPDPANNAAGQSKVHDKRTAACETLMHGYVRDNIGPGAIASRQHAHLVMGTDGGRGKTVTRKPRFKSLGTLIAGLAKAGRLGFEVIQSGGTLEFRTYPIKDKTATVVLDVEDDSISTAILTRSPLAPTNVIVGGNGHGVKRKFRDASTAETDQLSADWGRRVEVYMDYRGGDETPEASDLFDAGRDFLDDEVQAPLQLKITPSEYADKQYGTAYELGDKITVRAGGKSRAVTCTGLIVKVDENGARYGITLGDPVMSGSQGNVGNGPSNPKSPKGGKHVGDPGDRLDDLESYVPDLTETTLDGVDWAVDNRVLLLENGQTVEQYQTATGLTIQIGTIIFEKA